MSVESRTFSQYSLSGLLAVVALVGSTSCDDVHSTTDIAAPNVNRTREQAETETSPDSTAEHASTNRFDSAEIENRSAILCEPGEEIYYWASAQPYCVCPKDHVLRSEVLESRSFDSQGRPIRVATPWRVAECVTDLCPVGRFNTVTFRNCRCPEGETKRYQGLGKLNAYCTGTPCPNGNFSTTGVHRGCECPDGHPKKYHGIGNRKAYCQGLNECPGGKFSTVRHRGCSCPSRTKKRYWGIGKSRARCERISPQRPSSGGGSGLPVGDPKKIK